jgi:hypothetical protein
MGTTLQLSSNVQFCNAGINLRPHGAISFSEDAAISASADTSAVFVRHILTHRGRDVCNSLKSRFYRKVPTWCDLAQHLPKAIS